MTTHRPYKFQLVAIVQEIDEHGNVVGEGTIQPSQQEPFTIYGIDALVTWAKDFPDMLAALQPPEPKGTLDDPLPTPPFGPTRVQNCTT